MVSDGELKDFLPRCRAIARVQCRRRPYLIDEAESVAVAALDEAVRTYDPGRGEFRRHADRTVGCRVSDYLWSERPKGHGGPNCKAIDVGVLPLPFSALPGGYPLAPSGELPVGWEAEYHDEVTWLSRRLPPRHAEAFRLRFLHADAEGPVGCAARMGLQVARVVQLTREAVGMLAARSA